MLQNNGKQWNKWEHGFKMRENPLTIRNHGHQMTIVKTKHSNLIQIWLRRANQLTGFYMMRTLVVKGLKYKLNECSPIADYCTKLSKIILFLFYENICYQLIIIVSLLLSCNWSLFILPENIRKPLGFLCFQGV